MIDKQRTANLDKMSEEEADRLGDKIGGKVRLFIDEACEKANKLLSIYGLRIKVGFIIEKIEEESTVSTIETSV